MKKYLKRKTFKLKKEVEVSNKFNKAIEKSSPFEEMVKNNEEYKILLERKKLGESVEDLIRQNRINAKVLAKINKVNFIETVKVLAKKKGFDITSKTPEGSQKDKMNEMREKKQLITKFQDKMDKRVNVLKEIMKCNEEYKILIERKETGESVEDLIKQNRKYRKILAKEEREKIEETNDWMKSEEGRKLSAIFEETRRLNPDLTRDTDIRLERGFKISKEFTKNEEKYEELLERKKNGEYVDDLIKQNRYKAKVLAEQSKKVWDES